MRAQALVVAGLLAGCMGGPTPDIDAPLALALREIASGLEQPVHVWHDPQLPQRLYVVEQVGRITIMDRDGGDARTYLDIRDRVGSGGERGLFAVAFNPALKDRIFLHYTDKGGDTVVSSFARGETEADEASEAVFLRQDQPYSNHNGGQIAFAEDGLLYIGLGDGGSGGDPQGHGQNLGTLLGKILRVRPGNSDSYEIPEDNPFRGRAGAKPEIWAYGLRNPWRFSFDRLTQDLFIGDVGQNRWEEIDHLAAPLRGGANFGWNRFEGSHRFESGSIAEHVEPIHEYPTGPQDTCAVTGGYVYRGEALPALQGVYVFGDYCSGVVWGLQRIDGDWRLSELLRTDHRIASFGEDAQGELYLADHGGSVLRFVRAD